MTASSPPRDDDERWSQWLQSHGPAVRGYVLAMVRRPDLADDMTQEVFWRAWRGRERYREVGTARAYLLRIADRLVCDHGRKQGREVNLSE
jgi:RNA polymerase sigma-70 factor (ECF subfamily)